MARSKISIFNAALRRAGENKDLVDGDTAPEFGVLERNYPEIVGEAFEATRLDFGKVRAPLTTRSTGDFGFDHKYLLPTDFLAVLRVEVDELDPAGDWEINGTYLYIDDSDGIEIEYVRRGSESSWSSTFANGVIHKLAALIKEAVHEEPEEAERLDRMGETKLTKAGILASKQRADRRPYKAGFLMRSRRHGRRSYRVRGKA